MREAKSETVMGKFRLTTLYKFAILGMFFLKEIG